MKFLLWIGAGLLLFLLGWFLLLVLLIPPGFSIGGPEDAAYREKKAAMKEYFEGHRLSDLGRYEEAAAKYAPLEAWQERNGEDSSEVKGLIGRMLDLAGHPEEAEARLDKSLSMKLAPHVCVDKAHFLAHNRSLGAAKKWLDEVPVTPEERTRIKGAFFLQQELFADALPHLLKIFEDSSKGQFEFDDVGKLKVDLSKIDATLHNRIAGMLWPLEDLADCEFGLKDTEEARRFATMGISVGQALNFDKTYHNAAYLGCGSVRCRIVRARLCLQREDRAGARTELEFAQAVADWAYCGQEKELKNAWAELSNAGSRK